MEMDVALLAAFKMAITVSTATQPPQHPLAPIAAATAPHAPTPQPVSTALQPISSSVAHASIPPTQLPQTPRTQHLRIQRIQRIQQTLLHRTQLIAQATHLTAATECSMQGKPAMMPISSLTMGVALLVKYNPTTHALQLPPNAI